jgi:UDPglucose 6-dehydrogenase
MDASQAVQNSDASFVIVPTPSDSTGFFSNRFVLQAMETLGKALRNKTGYHMVVITSTVMPGSTGSDIKAALEAASGRKVGPDLGLCYNPEFIALGSVVRDMLYPDSILIGESDAKAGDMLQAIYLQMCENKPPVQRMNWVSAELTKISVNTYVTTKISYANMLAQVCERLPGADADVVTSAIGCDSRIGVKYLKGALGYGGPCFPRDNVAFSALARATGAPALLAEATDQLNRRQVPRLAEIIRSRLPEGGTVGILGLSYKPHTEVVEESQGLDLAKHLASIGVRVVVYDPAAMENAKRELGTAITCAASAAACARQADVLVITTAWPEFKNLTPADLKSGERRPAIVDCWRVLPADLFANLSEYLRLGYGGLDTNTEADPSDSSRTARLFSVGMD